MSARLRLSIFAVSAVALALVLAYGLAGLQQFGHVDSAYGALLARLAVPARHATNAVVVTAFDFRGLDTLVEELILLTAAIGVVALLRIQRGEHSEDDEAHQRRARPDPSETLRVAGAALVPATFVLGVYVVAHGQLSPGGGFQGGAVLAAAVVLLYASGQRFALRATRPPPFAERAEAIGSLGFALIGLGGLIAGGVYLRNVLGQGTVGELISGGTIPLSNAAVGLEVAGALALIAAELVDQALFVRED